MASAYTFTGAKPLTASDEGIINDVILGLKAIPHLPMALMHGVDDPNATEEERALRKRALSEAAQWVLPVVVSAFASPVAGAALKGFAKGPLIAKILTDAVAWGTGSGLAAGVQGEDPTKAALVGGVLGGAGGAASGLFKQGAVAGAKMAAEEAAAQAAKEAARKAEEIAGKYAAVGMGNKIAIEAGGPVVGGARLGEPIAAGTQGSLFDLGGRAIAQDARGAVNEGVGQGSLFKVAGTDTHPVAPGFTPAVEDFRRGMETSAGGVPSQGAAVDAFEIYQRGLSRIKLAEGPIPTVPRYTEPAIQLDMFRPPGQTSMAGPGFERVMDPTAAKPVLEQLSLFSSPERKDAALAYAFRNITPQPEFAAGPVAPRALGNATAMFAPDQVLASADKEAQRMLMLWEQHLGARRPAQTAKGIRATVAKATDVITKTQAFEEASLLLHRAFAPARTMLKKMGPAAGALANTLDDVFERFRLRGGEDVKEVRAIFAQFTAKERLHIGEIMEGLAAPQDRKYLDAANAATGVYHRYAEEIEGLGIRELLPEGGVMGFRARPNYLTRYYNEGQIKKLMVKGSPEFKQAMSILQKRGEAITEAEAWMGLKSWLDVPYEFRTGPINFPRTGVLDELGVPYEKDPLKVMSRYIYSVRKRLEVTREFGPDYRGMDKVYEAIIAEGGKKAPVERVFKAFSDALPREYPALVRGATTYNALTMLSTSGIVQPAQLLNVAAITGYGNLIRAMGMALKRENREWALGTGAYLNEAIQDMVGGQGAPIVQKFVHIIGLEPLDKANRVVAAFAGRLYATELAAKFMRKPTTMLATRLSDLGINPAELMAQEGKLTNDQLRKAAFRVSTDTQFASRITDLPELKNTTAGIIIGQFKSFAYQQTGFIQKSILAPAKTYLTSGGQRGSLAPLARFSSGLGPTGATIGEIVRGFKGRVAPDDPALRMIENLTLVGGFGIYADTFTALTNGPGRFLSFLTGPTGGEIANYMANDIPKALLKGDPTDLAKHIVKRIPIIGQPLANYWLYPPQ